MKIISTVVSDMNGDMLVMTDQSPHAVRVPIHIVDEAEVRAFVESAIEARKSVGMP